MKDSLSQSKWSEQAEELHQVVENGSEQKRMLDKPFQNSTN